MGKQLSVFVSSVFFVIGFSFVFSLLGVLLQSILLSVSYRVTEILGYVGGAVIIFFGVYLMGLISVPFLERERRIRIKTRFRSSYVASFVFGAAFAVGWTPCVGAVLGAILTFAATSPGSAFWLLLAYSLGLGIPFLIAGAFTAKLTVFIEKAGSRLRYLNLFFGALLVALGVLVFTNSLERIANFSILTDFLRTYGLGSGLNLGAGASLGVLPLGISFMAGVVSFLSPCILPLIPGYLTYLSSTAVYETHSEANPGGKGAGR